MKLTVVLSVATGFKPPGTKLVPGFPLIEIVPKPELVTPPKNDTVLLQAMGGLRVRVTTA